MAITERDESLHTPGTELPERWQENMMVYGWDLDHEAGFFFHVQRIPHSGFTEVKVVVCDADAGVSGRAVVPMPESSMFEGLVIEDPFGRARLSFDGRGTAHDSPLALPALSDAGTIPFGMDLVLQGKSGPADWYEGLSKMASTESHHYQVAGSFEGTLRYGDERKSVSGLFWRDHTWG